MNSRHLEILVTIEATTDALWTPMRCYTDRSIGPLLPADAMAAISERRERFLTHGVQFSSGGGGVVVQKQVERELNEMQAAGLLVVVAKYGRRTGVRLTALGDTLARYFSCNLMLHESRPLLARIAELELAGCSLNGVVSELDIVRAYNYTPEAGPKISSLDRDLIAAKVAGFVTDRIDMSARVFFHLTDAGRDFLDMPASAPELPEYEAKHEKWGHVYWDELRARLDGRPAWKAEQMALVFVPMSAGLWPEKRWHQVEAGSNGSTHRVVARKK